ncbi:MFS family permease [Silvibacterium bohemicum]|uniref:MFS family permease n=1 Tax=Silvibacterium bohemicum TaxID=1577686 RepID=A0A841JP15_9BACT|nr:MFS transporter [Silvibacterium bohemicum]MBB6143096.1 MFS family permease [Silvibacterium bohemicum]
MATTPTVPNGQTIETDIPRRLDRLPWSRWHLRILTALGTSWLLDGLEVTLVGSLASILTTPQGLSLTDKQVTAAASTYLAGAVFGALLFGYLTDRLGRKKLFLVTVATYSLATLASAFSWNFLSFAILRSLTGVGIGGEYAAINSAVDELIPGRVRGTVDLIVNGTFWIGGTVGALASIYLLSGHAIGGNHGWRFAFGIGGVLGVVIFLLRLSVPESPRWLMLRGQEQRAEEIVHRIENKISGGQPNSLPKLEGDPLKIKVRDHTPWRDIFANMLGENRPRTYLGLILMIAQAFFFNAVFFSYGLVCKTFFHIPDKQIPRHLLPFAIASFLGPLTIGRLFDTVGRKKMISITYCAAGIVLAGTAIPFATGAAGPLTVSICFSVVFFIASSAASAAYLTVSEIFPLELRAFAIAVFYALGTLAGGVGAPLFFGELIDTHSRLAVSLGYGLGSILMLAAGVCEAKFGIETAGKSLESISKPLQSG